jgi:hypothetical protein
VYRTALALLLAVVIGSTGTADAQEPDLITILRTLGFTNIVEIFDGTFPSLPYTLTLLAE